MSSPRNPETRADTLAGKFGKRPKEILEQHPDAGCSWYRPLFRCKCGNLSDKDSVVISDDGKTLYRPSMRCSLCHGKMWEIQNVPHYIRCPKCGEMMDVEFTMFWD